MVPEPEPPVVPEVQKAQSDDDAEEGSTDDGSAPGKFHPNI